MKLADIDKAHWLQRELEQMEEWQTRFRELAAVMPNGHDREPISGLYKLVQMIEQRGVPFNGPVAEKLISFARGILLEHADTELQRIRKELIALGVEMR